MRKAVLLLSIATLGLSLACGYLYRELRAARSQVDATAAQLQQFRLAAAPPRENQYEAAPAPSSATEQPNSSAADPRAAEQTPPLETPTARTNRREALRAEIVRRWSDPAWRARALARAKHSVREENPDLGSVLKLDAEQEAAFVELLTQQQLQIDEANEPMRFATSAERSVIQDKINALASQHQQDTAQFLGSARLARYHDYVREIPERQQLRELRSRLDESTSLTAAQSARLIDAMYQERDSYIQQMKSIEDVRAYSPQYPIFVVPRGGDAAARARFAEEQAARTEAFMSRIRLRAAEVLSAEQLRRFDEMQEEQQAAVQSQLERVRRQAARSRNRD